MTYGEHARKAREAKGYGTPKALALTAGVPVSRIQTLESDAALPRLSCVLAIVSTLGIGLNEYLGFNAKDIFWPEREGTIGEHARWIRDSRFMTRVELESLSGVSRSTIKNIEAGSHDPHLISVILLADALGISPDEYIGQPHQAKRRYRR